MIIFLFALNILLDNIRFRCRYPRGDSCGSGGSCDGSYFSGGSRKLIHITVLSSLPFRDILDILADPARMAHFILFSHFRDRFGASNVKCSTAWTTPASRLGG